MGSVRLGGVRLSGTPLQIALIFETLNDLPGQPDVASYDDLNILRDCEVALKNVRGSHPNPDGSGEYIDPGA